MNVFPTTITSHSETYELPELLWIDRKLTLVIPEPIWFILGPVLSCNNRSRAEYSQVVNSSTFDVVLFISMRDVILYIRCQSFSVTPNNDTDPPIRRVTLLHKAMLTDILSLNRASYMTVHSCKLLKVYWSSLTNTNTTTNNKLCF